MPDLPYGKLILELLAALRLKSRRIMLLVLEDLGWLQKRPEIK